MLAITNSITPEKLDDRFKPQPLPDAGDIIKKNEVLQTQEQIARPKKQFYTPQGTQISKALLNG